MAETVDATQFTRVDDTRDNSFFIQFLDARRGIEGERQVKELEIAMLAVDSGAWVLDVGCGIGDDAREIGGLVGPNGKVVGLDSSAAMVEESRKRASSSMQGGWVLWDRRACPLVGRYDAGRGGGSSPLGL